MRIERISGAMGLAALFTEIPERGKRTKRDYRA